MGRRATCTRRKRRSRSRARGRRSCSRRSPSRHRRAPGSGFSSIPPNSSRAKPQRSGVPQPSNWCCSLAAMSFWKPPCDGLPLAQARIVPTCWSVPARLISKRAFYGFSRICRMIGCPVSWRVSLMAHSRRSRCWERFPKRWAMPASTCWRSCRVLSRCPSSAAWRDGSSTTPRNG